MRRRLVTCAVLAGAMLLGGTGCPQRRGAAVPAEVVRATQRARRLRLVAPDVIAEADRALALARRAADVDDADAARAHFERAVVWIDVAEAVAREAAADDARLVAESRMRDARLRASRAEAERLAIDTELRRLAAVARAREAIDAARRRADAAEARRSPRAARDRTTARVELARMLVEEAATAVAAAESSDPVPAGTREAREALVRAEELAARIDATTSPNAVEAGRFRDAAEHAAELARALVGPR